MEVVRSIKNVMEFNEQKLKEVLKPYFDTARAGDWNHALRVVDYVKKLGEGRKDLYLLVTAAYVHDIGWSGVAPRGKIDFDEMLILESKANENSSKFISEVLNKLDFSTSEIETVDRIVAAVDKRRSEKDDESIVVDADNLSKLCLDHLKEKYQPNSFPKLISTWERELSSRIKTQKGKELFPDLLLNLKNLLNNS